MLFNTEIEENGQKVLLFSKNNKNFFDKFTQKLNQMNADITVKKTFSYDFSSADIVMFLGFSDIIPSELAEYPDKKFIIILFDDAEAAEMLSSFLYDHNISQIKVINLQSAPIYFEKDIDTIFWFTFSNTPDVFLHIYHQSIEPPNPPQKKIKLKFSSLNAIFTPEKLIFLGVCFILIAHLLFIPPLLTSTFLHLKAVEIARGGDFQTALIKANRANSNLRISKNLFVFARPLLHFFSIALPFEDLIQLNDSSQIIIIKTEDFQSTSSKFLELLFLKDKTDEEFETLFRTQEKLTKNITILAKHIQILEQKLPNWNQNLIETKNQLTEVYKGISFMQALEPQFNELFANNSEKKYLLLFANNMELRPGGGFIGSFAIVNVKNFTITSIELQDVYDADGQLKTQIDPPVPITTYLNQTHWYLRDSAFTPDFVENFAEAEYFLEEEINENNFDGGILITTTGVQNILKSIDKLYIPDFQETITSDNFYIKAQLYAEEDFFPGSQQKKSFLSSLLNQMIFKLQDASIDTLFTEIERSLNEKQLVLYSKNSEVQELFEGHYWAGRLLNPVCTIPEALHCIPDFLFPLDANLGVNKANFYVQRPLEFEVQIDTNGRITNTLKLSYKNTSNDNVFPGGTYKNYFQLLIPPNSSEITIVVDKKPLEQYDETNLRYKSIGFFLSIPPQQSKEVIISYELPTTLVSGDGIYQLILQKQIGSANSDLKFSLKYPPNMSVVRHNLSTLAKDNEIIYNTTVSSDKIFLIEFKKD